MRPKLVEKLKNSWKQAIKSGRIVELPDKKPSREFTEFDYYITRDVTEENWENFVVEDSVFRKQLASKKVEYNRIKCKGDYKLWFKVIQLILSIFMHRDGSFKDQNQSRSGPTPWKDSLVKFCNRVLYSLSRQQNYLLYNRLYTKLYDKRDDFDFHIVNFPFLSSNIPSSPSYGVYISQLIRYARCCSYYDDFGYRHKLLVDRLLSQGYEVKCLRNSFKKFYGRYRDLIGKYQRLVKDMVADSFPD